MVIIVLYLLHRLCLSVQLRLHLNVTYWDTVFALVRPTTP